MAERVSEETFEEKVLRAKLPVLADFYSDSCIPCKMLSPVLSRLESEYAGKLEIVKVNVNFDAGLAERYEVLASPTLIVFRDGSEVSRLRGAAGKEQIEALIDKVI